MTIWEIQVIHFMAQGIYRTCLGGLQENQIMKDWKEGSL